MNTSKHLQFPVGIATILVTGISVFGQGAPSEGLGSDNAWLFVLGVVVVIGIGAVVAWMMRSRERATNSVVSAKKSPSKPMKAKKMASSTKSGGFRNKVTNSKSEKHGGDEPASAPNPSLHGIDIEEVKEKMSRIRFGRLPINRFEELESPKQHTPLPEDNSETLMLAVEDSDVEYCEDESKRDEALDFLSSFKSRNSVEAISQVALYDVSSTLRSKAVGILADLDHPSVFEPIILACADPSREVRAAGARALFKVSFSRANAWMLIAECGDPYRISQVAKAAVEADFVDRSLERLVHEDVHYAQEAVALLALLIRANETDRIFERLEKGKDSNVKRGILHLIKIAREDSAFERLEEAIEDGKLAEEVLEDAKNALEAGRLVTA